MMAKAIATEVGLNFLAVKGPEVEREGREKEGGREKEEGGRERERGTEGEGDREERGRESR